MFVALERYARRYGMTKSQATRLAVRRLLEGAGLMKPQPDDDVVVVD